MFLDQIAGIETEDAGGTVITVSGNITGKYCWPILYTATAVLLIGSMCLLILFLKHALAKRNHA